MEGKTAQKRTRKKSREEAHGLPTLSDQEIEDLVGSLWENIDLLPSYIQALLHGSTKPGPTGTVSYALIAGWVMGKLEYKVAGPWEDRKSGWVPSESKSN